MWVGSVLGTKYWTYWWWRHATYHIGAINILSIPFMRNFFLIFCRTTKFRSHKIRSQLIHFIFRWTTSISTTTNWTSSTSCCHSIDSAPVTASATSSHLSRSTRYSTMLFNQWNEVGITKDATSLLFRTVFELCLSILIDNGDLLRSTFVAFDFG